jgi:phytoene dehydrogenase-like protein
MTSTNPRGRKPSQRKTMLIIGAGLGGLSTGCYAQMNGYRSTIIEMHSIPGGCCTAWDRGDYTFDWCISWMLGSGPGNQMHQIWRELGAIQHRKMHHFEAFNVVRDRDGQAVRFYSDPDRLERHLLDLSPADAAAIRGFCSDLRKFRRAIAHYEFLKPVGLMGLGERARMMWPLLPYYRMLQRSNDTLMTAWAEKLHSPLLRDAFNRVMLDYLPRFPLLPFYFQLASHANGSAGLPEGGSLGLARSIEERYLGLGGQMRYDTRVEEILVENDQAVGVRLSDGSELRADIVVSACDGRTTTMDMLHGGYLNKTYRRLFAQLVDEPEMIYPGYVSVFLGLDRTFPDEDPCTTWMLDPEEWSELLGIRSPSINVQFRSRYYPELAPSGKDIIYATYFAEPGPWRQLCDGPDRVSRKVGDEWVHTLAAPRTKAYLEAKRRVRDTIVTALDRRIPGLRTSIAVQDVAAPPTNARYTGSHLGTIGAWMPFMDGSETVEAEIGRHGPVLPGLKNFYLAGSWTTAGGLIRTVASGRHAVQYACRDDGLAFVATEPAERPSGRDRRPAANPDLSGVAETNRSGADEW